MRVRELRFLTTVVVIAACGLTVARGWDFVRYSLAAQSAGAETNPSDVLGAWTADPGLTSLALEAMLRARQNPADTQAIGSRSDILSNLLSVRPMLSQSWLELAAARNSVKMPPDRVADAFAMSELTGPNEGAVMARRALLGIVMWGSLSPEARATAVRDIIGMTTFNALQFRIILSAKPDATRAGIRAALVTAGCDDKKIESIGL
jgi:hypothetical protein